MNQPFVPNKTRFKKSRSRFKGGTEHRRIHLIKYSYGIVALTSGRIFSNHVEMIRRTITNFYKRNTKVLIRVIPTMSYTRKPFDVRRGKGKGSVEGWYTAIRKNRIVVEFKSATPELAKRVCKIVNSKLPIKVGLKEKELEIDTTVSEVKKVQEESPEEESITEAKKEAKEEK